MYEPYGVCVCVKPKHVNTRLQSHTIQTCVPFIYLEFQAHGVVGRADLTLGKDESAHDERDVVYIYTSCKLLKIPRYADGQEIDQSVFMVRFVSMFHK